MGMSLTAQTGEGEDVRRRFERVYERLLNLPEPNPEAGELGCYSSWCNRKDQPTYKEGEATSLEKFEKWNTPM